ncbi:unnamed protein product [Adineta ricciae]|uniref:Uncharacterized protein n=1 Tax=Adineta ricciae TaxID=249248 RepID=A0A814WED3_ADIRI|nr:unnamed protein product [Adineta ricciae]
MDTPNPLKFLKIKREDGYRVYWDYDTTRETTDPTGLIISTINSASLEPQSSILYSCNKDRCNDDATVNRVKQILIDNKLFNTTKVTPFPGGGADHLYCFGPHTFISLLVLIAWY